MATAAARTAPPQPVVEESTSARILRMLGKAPVHIFLIAVGLLWLIPTLGLFITSILLPEDQPEAIGVAFANWLADLR